MEALVLIILFIAFFIFSAYFMVKYLDFIAIPYSLLFLYTVFSQIGYIFYPEKLDLYSDGQYYGMDTFYSYWSYIFISFVLIFLLWLLTKSFSFKNHIKVCNYNSNIKINKRLYFIMILSWQLILSVLLILNYDILSYYNQQILKNNKLWFYMFSFDGIIIYSLYIKFLVAKSLTEKILSIILLLFSVIIFFITSLRSGQRIELVMTLIAFISFFYKHYGEKSISRRKNLFTFSLTILVTVMISQAIRSLRGSFIDVKIFLDHIKSNPIGFLNFFLFENLVFQDWLTPPLTLITSMYYKLIFPIDVVKSNILIMIPLISRKSLGEILARIINPYSWRGYGYTILTEGYNFMGFIGFFYSAVVFVLGFKFLELLFCKSNDKIFNSFMYGIIGFIILSVVRGQSASFVKSIYFYFLPAIILFILATGEKVLFVREKK